MIGIEAVKVDLIMNALFFSRFFKNGLCGSTLLIVGAALLANQGCTKVRHAVLPMARIEGVKRPFFTGQILDTKQQKAITYPRLLEKLAAANVVFLGELHDNPDHHLIQIQILQSLSNKWGHFALAVEFLPAQNQPIVDKYIKGEMSEEDFLKKVDWPEVWGFHYHFYRPLIDFQRYSRNPVAAINAPHDLVRKVAAKGLKSLNQRERALIAREIDLTDKQHRAFLKEVYESHSHERLKSFEYFYEAQCVWEETMAQNLAALLKDTHTKIVVICGNGHLVHGFGIPKRLMRRIKTPMVTLVPYTLKETTVIERDLADFVWFTGKYFRIPKRHPLKKRKSNGRLKNLKVY